MGVEIRIYVEGGGDRAEGRAQLRRGLAEFLSEVVDAARKMRSSVTIVACGGRGQTYDKLMAARRTYPRAFCVLLVDSEGPVTAPSDKQYLTARDGWDLRDTDEEQIHLMVQAMEAWLIADKAALAAYYGPGLHEQRLPDQRNVEEIPKEDLEKALKSATRDAKPKGEYHKIKHGAQLLGLVDPAKVRAAARHCDDLFVVLRRLLQDTA